MRDPEDEQMAGILELHAIRGQVLTQVILDIGVGGLVKARQVSKVFDGEVMAVLEGIRLFHPNCPEELSRALPSREKNRLPHPSYAAFIGSFLATRPHKQEPWNANISASLNRIADEMMAQSGLASALRLRSSLFGSLFGVAVKSGQVDLVVHLLGTGLDINDEFHEAIEMASQRDQPDMLALLFRQVCGILRPGPRISRCIYKAIQIGHVASALFLIDVVEQQVSHWETAGVFAAACYSYVEVVKALMDRGVRPDPLALRAAAMNGDVSMAKFLVAAGARPDPSVWCKVLLIAEAHYEFEFARSMLEQVVSVNTLLEDVDEAARLLLHACTLGDVYMVRALAARISPTYTTEAGETPVYAALLTEQQRCIDVLIQMGASPLDVFYCRQKCGFEYGRVAKPWPKRKNIVGNVTTWQTVQVHGS
ncbi:ankyrin [Hypoxylon sp. FL1857]|nr:ankyrin [Hypoxylon sp. FL1857]